MEQPTTDTKPIPNYGRHSKKKEPRSNNKALKRMSALALGDSTTTTISTGSSSSSTKSRARDKEAMAASFLQYCAMCEKQIMTPSNSLLYCSEACRRKDSAKPLSASMLSSPPAPRPASVSVSVPSSPRPMASIYHQSAPVLRIPPVTHGHKSDLDPTEWKPKLGDGYRKTSEAFRYLSQFHQTVNDNAITIIDTPSLNETTAANGNGGLGLFRPVYYNSSTGGGGGTANRPTMAMHRSTMSMTTTTSTPSLSLNSTPTTAASSFDSSTYASYEFNLRPLPPRQNPLYYSTSAGAGRGIDLVTPHVAPPIDALAASSMPTVYDHDFWGKKVVPVAGARADDGTRDKTPSLAANADGLGALLGKAA